MIDKIVLYFKGLKSEFNKIIFPLNETIIKHSVVVLVCSFIVGLIIFIFDSILSFGFGLILK